MTLVNLLYGYRFETWDIILILSMLFPFCGTITFYSRYFLPFHERRKDLIPINDVVLNATPLVDTSFTINILLYSLLLLFMLNILFWQLVNVPLALLSYMLLIWTRIVMITLMPLRVRDPFIPLNDTIQDIFLGEEDVFVNDLFFSGHVSTIVMLGLNTDSDWQPYIYYVTAFIVSVLMILLKAHYTIDLLVAPYISYCTFNMSKFILEWIKSHELSAEIEMTFVPIILASLYLTVTQIFKCVKIMQTSKRSKYFVDE